MVRLCEAIAIDKTPVVNYLRPFTSSMMNFAGIADIAVHFGLYVVIGDPVLIQNDMDIGTPKAEIVD